MFPFATLSPDWLEHFSWPLLLRNYGLPALSALLILLLGLWLARHLCNLLPPATARAGIDPMLGAFLRNIAYITCVVIVLVLTIATLGVPVSPLLAVLGTAGLAVGLALKDSLSNIASGVMLVTLRPFHVGDSVQIAGQSGTIEAVRIFHTVLHGADNQRLTIPNNLITASPIINLTAQPTRRIELVVGISYRDDIAQARALILQLLHADPRVLKNPQADVLVYELAASSVNLGVRCFVRAGDWFATKTALLEQIKLGFDRTGLNLPYPQQDLHLYLHGRNGETLAAETMLGVRSDHAIKDSSAQTGSAEQSSSVD